jgi:inositol hexakisphosphate/diphosphoinositol-pentakisphosphate kinase
VAKQLADCVIPNEYGIDAGGKIRIGAKICCALLGKLLADLSNMQEESIATAVSTSVCFTSLLICT